MNWPSQVCRNWRHIWPGLFSKTSCWGRFGKWKPICSQVFGRAGICRKTRSHFVAASAISVARVHWVWTKHPTRVWLEKLPLLFPQRRFAIVQYRSVKLKPGPKAHVLPEATTCKRAEVVRCKAKSKTTATQTKTTKQTANHNKHQKHKAKPKAITCCNSHWSKTPLIRWEIMNRLGETFAPPPSESSQKPLKPSRAPHRIRPTHLLFSASPSHLYYHWHLSHVDYFPRNIRRLNIICDFTCRFIEWHLLFTWLQMQMTERHVCCFKSLAWNTTTVKGIRTIHEGVFYTVYRYNE